MQAALQVDQLSLLPATLCAKYTNFLAGPAALGNAHRLHILASLTNKRNYVSQLAREVGISRPLLIMHLKRLEEAGLVSSTLELSGDGKAVRYYTVEPFEVVLNPGILAKAARTLERLSDSQ